MYSRLEFPNDELLTEITAWDRRFTYQGGTLIINQLFNLQPHDENKQESEVGIAVLCDGIPVPFTVKGEDMEPTLFYNKVFSTNVNHILQFSIDPAFTEEPGHVEILIWPSMEVFGTSRMGGGSFFVEDTASVTAIDTSVVVETIPIREELIVWTFPSLRTEGHDQKVWGSYPDPVINLEGQTALIYEYAPSEIGRHRTVFFLDNQVVSLPGDKLCLEWTQKEGQMVQYRIPLDGLLTPGYHRFFVYTTLLDGLTKENSTHSSMNSSGIIQVIP